MSSNPTDIIPLGERENFITRLADAIGAKANAAAVFGEPVTRDNATVIPVARARWGCGGGSGQASRSRGESGTGFGGGGGMIVNPVGYLVIREGEVQYREIDPTMRILTAVIAGVLLGAIFRFGRRGFRA